MPRKEMPPRVKAAYAVTALREMYPKATCALEWGGQGEDISEEARVKQSWRLLVMARLSAQCTDARVNIVCRELFEAYPTVEAMAEADVSDIESIIRPCGLFRTKAQSIKASCEILVEKYRGIVPDSMEELLALPGVGRKIANLLLGDVYRRPAVVTDTHCIRICGRLGFYPESMKDPLRAEKLLAAVIDPREQSDFCHRIVQFGRDVCTARAPACEKCPMGEICDHRE